MTKDRIRWGVLGAAKIARTDICPAIHQTDRGEIAAIASRTPGKAEALARPYGNVSLYDDYDALLAATDIDAIYIPLANHDHAPWTEKCLRAGKHVLCEKPIALKADEIDALIAARDETGCFAAEAFMVTHHAQWRRVRDLLAEGRIGRLKQVQGAFTYFNDDLGNIRNQPDLGGGALRDIGVYPSVTTRFATGEEPEAIEAEIEWENGVDATARVRAAFPGFQLDFYVSMRMALRQQMVFHGTEGVITVEAPFNAGKYADAIVSIRRGDLEERERFAHVAQYQAQADAFHATVLHGADFACPLEFSRGNQVMIDRIYAAAS